MKILKKMSWAAFGNALALSCCSTYASGFDDGTEELNRSIAELTHLLSDSYAEPVDKSKRIVRGKIFNKDAGDALVIFSLEGFDGGNTFRQYIAIFSKLNPGKEIQVKNRKQFQLLGLEQIGGSGWRAAVPESIKIIDQTFVLRLMPCFTAPPQCDSSKIKEEKYKIQVKPTGSVSIFKSIS